MDDDKYISARDFCVVHQIDITFVQTLGESGLLEITTIGEAPYIDLNNLHKLERLMRMHYDLEINLPGIETIVHLLQKMENMHTEIAELRSRLSIYEDPE